MTTNNNTGHNATQEAVAVLLYCVCVLSPGRPCKLPEVPLKWLWFNLTGCMHQQGIRHIGSSRLATQLHNNSSRSWSWLENWFEAPDVPNKTFL